MGDGLDTWTIGTVRGRALWAVRLRCCWGLFSSWEAYGLGDCRACMDSKGKDNILSFRCHFIASGSIDPQQRGDAGGWARKKRRRWVRRMEGLNGAARHWAELRSGVLWVQRRSQVAA